jgi:hypothetical protein
MTTDDDHYLTEAQKTHLIDQHEAHAAALGIPATEPVTPRPATIGEVRTAVDDIFARFNETMAQLDDDDA